MKRSTAYVLVQRRDEGLSIHLYLILSHAEIDGRVYPVPAASLMRELVHLTGVSDVCVAEPRKDPVVNTYSDGSAHFSMLDNASESRPLPHSLNSPALGPEKYIQTTERV